MLALTRCWRRQNTRVDKMLALTNYSRWQITRVDKIIALTEISRQQNPRVDKKSSVNKMLVHVQKHLLTVWLSRVHSSWLLPNLADVLLRLPDGVDSSACNRQVCPCLCPPCFYGRTLSRTVPACCTGLLCRKRHKYWSRQNIGARQDFTDFRQTIAVNISANRRPIKNWWKQKVITITVQYQFIYSWPPKTEAITEIHRWSLCTLQRDRTTWWGEGGGRRGGGAR